MATKLIFNTPKGGVAIPAGPKKDIADRDKGIIVAPYSKIRIYIHLKNSDIEGFFNPVSFTLSAETGLILDTIWLYVNEDQITKVYDVPCERLRIEVKYDGLPNETPGGLEVINIPVTVEAYVYGNCGGCTETA